MACPHPSGRGCWGLLCSCSLMGPRLQVQFTCDPLWALGFHQAATHKPVLSPRHHWVPPGAKPTHTGACRAEGYSGAVGARFYLNVHKWLPWREKRLSRRHWWRVAGWDISGPGHRVSAATSWGSLTCFGVQLPPPGGHSLPPLPSPEPRALARSHGIWGCTWPDRGVL